MVIVDKVLQHYNYIIQTTNNYIPHNVGMCVLAMSSSWKAMGSPFSHDRKNITHPPIILAYVLYAFSSFCGEGKQMFFLYRRGCAMCHSKK